MYLVARRAFVRVSDIYVFLVPALTIAAVVAAYGVCEFLAGANPLFGPFFGRYNPHYSGVRPSSSLGNPVALAAYVVLCLPFALHLLRTGTRRIERQIAAIVTGTCSFALIASLTRGAWVAAIISLAFYSGLSRVGLSRLLHVSTLLIVLLFFVESIGFGQYTALFETIKTLRMPDIGIHTTDNMYLMIVAETGIAGIIALFLMITAILLVYRQSYQCSSGRLRDLVCASRASFVACLVHMAFWDAWNFPCIRIAFWMTLAIGIAAAQSTLPRNNELVRRG